MSVSLTHPLAPRPAVVLELLKPITWFAPMWAFACGMISSGAPFDPFVLLVGLVLTGPMVCAASQAVNDWYDRHVDAINQPERPIPSGRLPGRWGLYVAFAWTGLSLATATLLDWPGVLATLVGLALAWAYSAPPFRLKQNGWWGNAAVGACYEGLPWFTGAAVLVGGWPDGRVIALAALYSVGAHGIMTLNDFKAIEGDTQSGVRSLPVQLGADRAAWLACLVMAGAQVVVIGLLALWGMLIAAAVVTALLCAQIVLMRRLVKAPRARAAWYNATGTTLYVWGMMAAAIALGQASG